MTTTTRPPYLDLVAGGHLPRPTVLVIGGFITSPPLYRPFVQRLLDRGAADVIVASVWTTDWLLASWQGMGTILTRASRALLRASARSAELSLGAPVLVVGHSAGGMTARLLTSPVPFAGRPLHGSSRIGAIVTLGTPHVGRRDGTPAERGLWSLYQGISPDPALAEVEGDGLVPLPNALLPGAPSLVFDDAGHGQAVGSDWYGSDRFLDRWWPLAIETWEGALRARAEAVAQA